jgi:hypothetical protein
MSDKVSASDRVQAAFRKLSFSAANLNTVSDQLRDTISKFENVLRKLNLGISAWVRITGNEDNYGNYWTRDLGYAKVNGDWQIALRECAGHLSSPEDEHEEKWPFNEAPRWLRIDAIDKLPELLEKLTDQADTTTELIRKKIPVARELATAVQAATEAFTTAKAK